MRELHGAVPPVIGRRLAAETRSTRVFTILFHHRVFQVFEQLRSVGANEEAQNPIEEHPGPVEVVAELVEINRLPDGGPKQASEPHAQDVHECALGPEVYELAQGTVAEQPKACTPYLCGQIAAYKLPLLLSNLDERWDGWAVVIHAGTVTDSVNPRPVPGAQALIHENAPTFVLGGVQARDEGAGVYTRSPDSGACSHHPSVGELHGLWRHLL